jgi:excisionase family DNA binding protein
MDLDGLECVAPDDLAKLLRVSKSQVYTLARKGEIPHVRAGGSVLFPRRQLERWIEEGCRASVDGSRARVDRLAARRGSRRGQRG